MLCLLLAMLSMLGMQEFFAMALPARKNELLPFSLLGALIVVTPLLTDGRIFIMSLTAAFLLAGFHFLFRLRDISTVARDLSHVVTALIYIPFLIAHLMMIRLLPSGSSWLLLIMFIVMTNDAAAYYIGSAFGKHRLYEAVSPKKSVEGALGGLAGGLIGAYLAKIIFFAQLGYADIVITALVVGVI